MLVLYLVGSLALLSSSGQDEQRTQPIGARGSQSVYEEEQVDPASRTETFRVAQQVGQCIVRADSRSSMALLATDPGTLIGYQALDPIKAVLPNCLANAVKGAGSFRVQIQTPVLRGAIASALYQLQVNNRPPSDLAAPSSIAPIIVSNDSKFADWVSNYGFVQCLTEAQPTLVRQFILTKAVSSDEVDALARLTPFMAACVSRGTAINTDRNSLRFMLAESLYRWSITAAQMPAKAANAAPH